jgi:uroporphyrinogen-III synthase
MPEEYVAEAVVAALRQDVRRARVLLVRARVARDVIPRELSALGAKVDVVEAYETIVPEASRISLGELLGDPERRPQIIPFTSSSTVRNFVELAGADAVKSALRAGTRLASIGPVTSATLQELGLPIQIEAREYTIPGLVDAIAEAETEARS